MTDLADELQRWRFLEDCLLLDLHLIMFGYGVELKFNYVWTPDGRSVREDALDNPAPITLRLLGVDSMHFEGALTASMKAHPDQINWGLSEIARVSPVGRHAGLGLSVVWEGGRRIDVDFTSFELIAA